MRTPPNHLWGNRYPICPYCKEAYDTSEWRAEDDEYTELTCDKCEKKFDCLTRVEVVFDTVGSCPLNNEMPHNLKGGYNSFECTKCKAEIYDWELEGGIHEKFKKNEYNIESPCWGEKTK